MHPELIKAVKERHELGYSKDKVRDELKTAGHEADVVEEVLESVWSGIAVTKAFCAPATSVLITSAFSFLKRRRDLLLALAIPGALITILEYVTTVLPVSVQESAEIAVGLVSLFLLIFYVLILMAALFTVTQGDEREVSIKEALVWSRKNVWNILWIYILMTLVIWGGFILFVVPGIILWIVIHFSQYIYVHEGIRGMSALRRSHDLVKGKWLRLAKPLSLVGLLMLIIFLLLGGVAGLAEGISSGNDFVEMVSVLILNIFSAGATIFGLSVGEQLYRSIKLPVPSSKKTEGNWKYVLLSMVAILSVVGVGVSVGELEEEYFESEGVSLEANLEAKAKASELRINNTFDSLE